MRININDIPEDAVIATSGGEYYDKESDYDMSGYSLDIGEVSITLSPKQAVGLCKVLKDHLENNGHKI